MKKSYKKVPHFTKRKYRLLIKLFAGDSDAAKIASIVGISRNAAERWINRFRARILHLAEQEKLKDATSVQVDETYFTPSRKIIPKHTLPSGEICVLGIINDKGKVWAQIVDKANKLEIIPIVLACCSPGGLVCTDGAGVYKGLGKLGFDHRFISHADDEYSRYERGLCITTNRIEGFWGCMKVRLAKFRGIKRENLHIHIAESVWRFNHRHDNLYKLLLHQFRVMPL